MKKKSGKKKTRTTPSLESRSHSGWEIKRIQPLSSGAQSISLAYPSYLVLPDMFLDGIQISTTILELLDMSKLKGFVWMQWLHGTSSTPAYQKLLDSLPHTISRKLP